LTLGPLTFILLVYMFTVLTKDFLKSIAEYVEK